MHAWTLDVYTNRFLVFGGAELLSTSNIMSANDFNNMTMVLIYLANFYFAK
jgi:hypothetical protein